MTCGIYAIVCTKTWRSYVGQSVTLESRFKWHLQELRRKIHNNIGLQKDFNIFGEVSFFYEIIEYCDELKLGDREAFWISNNDNLYNKTNPSRDIKLTSEEIKRFWNWVKIGGTDDCWEWFGASDKDGYGRLGFRRNGKKRMFRANRIAYFINNPQDDINLIIRHKCNNSKCCNPDHLCIGSNSQNALDKLDNKNNHYKLNWDIVNDLRNKFKENPYIKQQDLATWLYNEYKINIPASYLIKVCKNENWIDKNYYPPIRTIRYSPTDYDKEIILNYLNSGLPVQQILKKINVEHNIPISKTNIHRIIKKIKYKGGV